MNKDRVFDFMKHGFRKANRTMWLDPIIVTIKTNSEIAEKDMVALMGAFHGLLVHREIDHVTIAMDCIVFKTIEDVTVVKLAFPDVIQRVVKFNDLDDAPDYNDEDE